MMQTFKELLTILFYALILILVPAIGFFSFQAALVYYHKHTSPPVISELTGTELKLLIPFKVKPDEEEFRLGEIYIDKQGYLRQKKGE